MKTENLRVPYFPEVVVEPQTNDSKDDLQKVYWTDKKKKLLIPLFSNKDYNLPPHPTWYPTTIANSLMTACNIA